MLSSAPPAGARRDRMRVRGGDRTEAITTPARSVDDFGSAAPVSWRAFLPCAMKLVVRVRIRCDCR